MLQLLEKHEGSPKLSIGYAQTGPNDYISFEELVQQADEQMYEVKKQMKGV